MEIIQCRHLVPAPVKQTSAIAWLYNHPWITCFKNKPSTSVAHDVDCKSKQRSVVRSGVQLCIMPWLPTHLVQELNASTVAIEMMHTIYIEC